jgi:predicted Fe-S protein YdhL (DUF1289 family)
MTPTNLPPEGLGPVPSPCNSICTIDQVTGFCAGCFRTLDEVAVWSVLDDREKRAVWAALPGRRAACEPTHDGDGAPRTGTHGQR